MHIIEKKKIIAQTKKNKIKVFETNWNSSAFWQYITYTEIYFIVQMDVEMINISYQIYDTLKNFFTQMKKKKEKRQHKSLYTFYGLYVI